MSSLKSFLRRLRILNPFDREDIEAAEAENATIDHSAVMERFTSSSETLRGAQHRLRGAIKEAKRSTSSAQRTNEDAIAHLVHDMRSSGQPYQRK